MDKIYFLVTKSSFWKTDSYGFLHTYFIEGDGFKSAMLIALAVAVVAILVYYAWIGMVVPRLSNLTTWLVSLVVVGAATFAITQTCIIGSKASNSGLFASITTERQQLANQQPPSEIDAFNTKVNNFEANLSKPGNEIALYTDLTNVVLALVFFFALSLCVKRATRYAINIPF